MSSNITVDSLLTDIRRANIPPEHADVLVAAVQLHSPNPSGEQQQYPLVHPGDMNIVVPSRHGLCQYNGFVFVHPHEEDLGPFYLVTHGKLVGVFSRWINVAPLVLGVKCSVYEKVLSVDLGFRLIHDAIDDNIVRYLNQL